MRLTNFKEILNKYKYQASLRLSTAMPRTLPLLFRKPFVILIEPTNTCNLNCQMCIRGDRPVGMMNLNLFKQLIDEAADIGKVLLFLHVGGESLLHPDFIEMLEYTMNKHDRFREVGFFTNGTLFTEKVADAVVRLGIDFVNFSVDGVGDVTQNIRRGSNYETVKKNIQFLIELRGNKLKPRVSIVTTITVQSDDELRNVQKEWMGKIDNVAFGPQLDYDFRVMNLPHAQQFNPSWIIDHPCKMPFSWLCVLWNGDLTYCCHNIQGKYLIGNAKETALLKSWRSKQMAHIRKGILLNSPIPGTLCEKCRKYDWATSRSTLLEN